MTFSDRNQTSDRYFNKADSFAMAFDSAWESLRPEEQEPQTSQDEKISMVISQIKDHPFLLEHPLQAKEIIKFRIRLLGLK